METTENPESLPAFQALRVAAVGRPERSMGEAIIAAEPPRWSEVREHARALESGPAHLEVGTALVRAGLVLDGFPGLEDALSGLADTLENDWATMYPEPDEDDPDEPWYERTNLVADLAADAVFRDALARAPLVEARGIGAFSARDMDVADGSAEASDEERARCQQGLIDGAFAEADADALATTKAALDGALAASRRAAAVLEREIGAGGGRAMTEIADRLAAVGARFGRAAGPRLAADDGPAANDAALAPSEDGTGGPGGPSDAATPASGAGGTGSASAAAPLALGDRVAVRAALDAILTYYDRHEPGSPVAALVARARTLVGRGFFELVGTLCPENDAGADFAARLTAPRRDPLVTLLQEGFGEHLAGGVWPVPVDDAVDPPESSWSDPESESESEPDSVDVDADPASSSARSDSDPAPHVDAAGASVPAPRLPAAVAVTTRDEVVRTLDDVLAFYRVREPSSPVPLVLERVRTLVPLDFDGVLDALRRALAADAAASAALAEDV